MSDEDIIRDLDISIPLLITVFLEWLFTSPALIVLPVAAGLLGAFSVGYFIVWWMQGSYSK